MPKLPYLDLKKKINNSPHVVILGAGASLAAFPEGDTKGKKLPLMNNLIDVIGLDGLFNELKIDYSNRNFEDIYSELAANEKNDSLLQDVQTRVRDYFYKMELPKEATLYDKLIISLRRKDVIATFNWDPLLAKAYIRNLNLKELPQILFLHGNTYVGLCRKDKVKGYAESICLKCGADLEPSPLLFPIRDKNYTKDLFIGDEWKRLSYWLKYAYFVTIFGYSAPKTDAAARKILADSFNGNDSKELAEIEIIDIQKSDILESNWKEFVDKKHYAFFESFEHSYILQHPRRTCEALAFATLQQDPWPDAPYSQTNDLKKLQDEAMALIEEELSKREELTDFERW